MKLFVVHVGYYDYEVGMYELHSQFMVPAINASDAKAQVMTKPVFQSKRMHIDGIQELNQVDGYTINLSKAETDNENKIYTYLEIKTL